AADFFDTLQSKRLYPYLVVGSSAGGVAGGTVAAFAGAALPAESLIAIWSLALLIGAWFVARHRSNLRRWRTVGSEERDESSAAGMRGALRFVRRSPLAGWLVISIVGMISSLFLIQFLYMGIMSNAFDSAETLAIFLGVYLAVSNAVEIGTATVLTPWLLRRFGVPTANLVHPALTVLVFPFLWWNPVLITAVAARAVRELLENAMAAPIRQLSYNALAFRFRGRVRALLEGVVLFAAMATAGVVLIAIGERVPLATLCALGAGLGLAYLFASLFVRREYLRSLVSELRRGRLDLHNLEVVLGQSALSRLAEQWEDLLREEREFPPSSALRFAHDLAEQGFGEVVARASHHPHPRVRATCIEALLEFAPDLLEPDLERLLCDEDAGVRREALCAAVEFPARPAAIEARLQACLEDVDPRVRAQAALALGPRGEPTLRALLESPDSECVVAALDCLPAKLTKLALLPLHDEAPQVRSAAIGCLAREAFEAPLPAAELLEALNDPHPRVREAAARALVFCQDDRVPDALARALDDGARAVRVAASQALSDLGQVGVATALPHITHPRLWTAHAALQAVAGAREIDVRTSLLHAYRMCVIDAWKHRAAVALAPDEPTVAARFLRAAVDNAGHRKLQLAFEVLAVLEDPLVVQSVRRALERGSHRDRADALEVLSHLGDREASGHLALLLETSPFLEKLPSVAGFLEPPHDLQTIIADIRHDDDRWLRLAAGPFDAASQAANQLQPEDEVDLMQTLLARRKVPRFTELSLDRLEIIHQLMTEAEYLRGECVVREGDPGDDLYVLIEGELEFYKNYGTSEQRLLNTFTPVA
ncbi:MAG: hypothetical protein GY944_26005, partial [bacterium]|nr:hypothetical protein [bacterium]